MVSRRQVKKYLYLMRSFFATIRSEGIVRTVRRLYYFVRYGKGVASREEYDHYRMRHKIPAHMKHVREVVRPTTSRDVPMSYDGPPIDIIIPVYNGYEYLAPLFDSIVAHTDMPYRVIVIDDASPDEQVMSFVAQLPERYPSAEIIVQRNAENVGFVRSVNAGMAQARSHCVVLNTDTEVPPRWLSRLLRPIIEDATIASATPMTNAGEIFSFPEIITNNAMLCNATVAQVDHFFQKLVPQEWITVPTGMGFCMAMNKAAYDRIGTFDAEAFGRGYAEENDWCQRAIAAGFTNVVVPNLFVYHKHGGSFLSKEKQKLLAQNLRTLNQRYPGYDRIIQQFITDDPLRGVRMVLLLWIAANLCAKKTVLYIDHELGGGANASTKERIAEIVAAGNAAIVVSYNVTKDVYHLAYHVGEHYGIMEASTQEDLVWVLAQVPLHEVVVSQVVSYPAPFAMLTWITEMIARTKARSTFLVHDFYAVCPSFNLLNDRGVYCGVPQDVEVCMRCMAHNKGDFRVYSNEKDIRIWRKRWLAFLQGMDAIVCFSQSSKEIMVRAYPSIADRITIIPHEVHYITAQPKITPRTVGQEIVVGVLGGINYQKGSHIVRDMVREIERRHLPVRVVVIGHLALKMHSEALTVHGIFQQGEIVSLTEHYKIDVFIIPSIWPETFSYTAEEVMKMHMPLAVFDLGAPAERVKNYDKGMIVHEMTATAMLDQVCAVYRGK